MNYPRKITLVKRLLPDLLRIPPECYESFIKTTKYRMVNDMMAKYPSNRYELICFDIERSDAELFEAIEVAFKRLDGRYVYNSEFVSREFLEKKFENVPYKIVLTAYTLN